MPYRDVSVCMCLLVISFIQGDQQCNNNDKKKNPVEIERKIGRKVVIVWEPFGCTGFAEKTHLHIISIIKH